MELIIWNKDWVIPQKAVVTIGTFDGVHTGHQKIIQQLTSIAKKVGLPSVVLTFWPHPKHILSKTTDTLKILTDYEEKVAFFKMLSIDYLIVVPFNETFANLSSQQFIEKIIQKSLQTHTLIIGYDHRFGKNREGSFAYLENHKDELGFEIAEIPPFVIEQTTVSSTKIRNALLQGDIALANEYLGRKYAITGKVEHGNQLGRELGFPTANIKLRDENKLTPKEGVYAVWIESNDQYFRGMLNIGVRPTINGSSKRIEVHLFDFSGDLYDQNISVYFVKRLRDEIKFSALNHLQAQLMLDKTHALEVFSTDRFEK